MISAVALVAVDMLVAWAFDRLETAHPLLLIGHAEYISRLLIALVFIRFRARGLASVADAPLRIPRALFTALVVATIAAAGALSFQRWKLATLTVVTAPVVEEIIYRAIVLQRFLVRMPAIPAIVLDTALFTALHAGPYGMRAAIWAPLAGGLVFSTIYWAFRSFWPSVLAHSLANAVVLFVTAPN